MFVFVGLLLEHMFVFACCPFLYIHMVFWLSVLIAFPILPLCCWLCRLCRPYVCAMMDVRFVRAELHRHEFEGGSLHEFGTR